MATYTIHFPPQDDPEKARFIRDGVSVLALAIPFLWLLWHRLWVELLAYVAVVIVLGLSTHMLGASALLLSLLPGLYLFFEGNQLVRARLARAGWRLADVVEAGNAQEAEIRFFHAPEPAENVDPPIAAKRERPVDPLSSYPPAGVTTGIGIFPE